MHINVCKHCNTVYVSRFKTYACNNCKEQDELLFEQIKGYLRSYPNSNAMQIADALGISAYVVVNYLNEGRLVVTKGKFERL